LQWRRRSQLGATPIKASANNISASSSKASPDQAVRDERTSLRG